MPLNILFVYHADSGLGSALMDSLHKLISPKTYACHLCQLTHGVLSERKSWKSFLASTQLSFEFLHRDEFKKVYGFIPDLPMIYEVQNQELKELLSPSAIKDFNSDLDLINYFINLEKSFAAAE